MCAFYKRSLNKDIVSLLKKMFNKKIFSNLILFGLSKGGVFVAPLLAASVLSRENYGLLEWALSTSMIIGVVLSFGTGGVLAFEIVKDDNKSLISSAFSYAVIITFVLGITGILGLIFNLAPQIKYVINFSGLFIGQFALSAYLKANGKGAFASIAEAFVYSVILFLVFISYINNINHFKYLVLFPFSTLIFSAILFYLGGKKVDFDTRRMFIFFKRGFPIMLSSLFALGFVNIPRVLLGSLESLEQLATFSLYFRWAAIAFVAYQFALVINFREIYTFSYVKLDSYIAIISLGVFLLGVVVVVFLVLLRKFGILLGGMFPKENLMVQGVMAGIIALWSLSASLEGLFYRENLTKWQIFATVIGIGVFLGSLVFFKRTLLDVVFAFVVSWFFAYTIVIFSQLSFLKKNISQFSLRYAMLSVSLISLFGWMLVIIGWLL